MGSEFSSEVRAQWVAADFWESPHFPRSTRNPTIRPSSCAFRRQVDAEQLYIRARSSEVEGSVNAGGRPGRIYLSDRIEKSLLAMERKSASRPDKAPDRNDRVSATANATSDVL